MRGISAVVVIVLLLLISIALISAVYIWATAITTSTTTSGTEQVSELTKQLSSCMRIDAVSGNKIYLRNCGKGVITNESLSVFIDEAKVGHSTETIGEGKTGEVNVSGLWKFSLGRHNLKITNGATFANALIELEPNKDGLVGSWSFDEGSGNTAYDSSGNGNDGELKNGVTWTDGKFGKALSFDGVDDYVEVPSNANLDSPSFSVVLWVKLDTASDGKVTGVIGKWASPNPAQSWRIYKTAANKLEFDAYGEIANIDTYPLDMDRWYLIVATYDDNIKTARIYQDGVLVREKNISPNTMKNTISGTLKIGGANTNYFHGIIDEVRIWNKALTPDQTVVMKRVM